MFQYKTVLFKMNWKICLFWYCFILLNYSFAIWFVHRKIFKSLLKLFSSSIKKSVFKCKNVYLFGNLITWSFGAFLSQEIRLFGVKNFKFYLQIGHLLCKFMKILENKMMFAGNKIRLSLNETSIFRLEALLPGFWGFSWCMRPTRQEFWCLRPLEWGKDFEAKVSCMRQEFWGCQLLYERRECWGLRPLAWGKDFEWWGPLG